MKKFYILCLVAQACLGLVSSFCSQLSAASRQGHLAAVKKLVYKVPTGNGDTMRLALAPVELPHEVGGPSGPVSPLGVRPIPSSLGQSDFNADHVPDIITGYAGPSGGVVTIRLGEPESMFPTRRHQDTEVVVPFGVERRFALPIVPEFLATGDFNNDGDRDVLAADSAVPLLVLLPGDGTGVVGEPETFPLPGRPTALLAGDFGQPDGLADLAMAIVDQTGPALLVWQNQAGALLHPPDRLNMPTEVIALEAGDVDGDFYVDLMAATKRQLLVVHAVSPYASQGTEESQPSSAKAYRFKLTGSMISPQARQALTVRSQVEIRDLGFEPGALAVGDFDGDRHADLAVLDRTGRDLIVFQGVPTVEGLQSLLPTRSMSIGLSEAGTKPQLLCANLNGDSRTDLVAIDGHSHQLALLMGDSALMLAQPLMVRLEESPMAVLTGRYGLHARDDLVIVLSGGRTITVLNAPLVSFTVTNTNDSGAGSLREAITSSNSNGVADVIDFSIGAGPHTISLLSALPPLTEGNLTIQNTSGETITITKDTGAGNFSGIDIKSSSNVIDNLTITGMSGTAANGNGIVIRSASATSNVIQGCTLASNNHDGVFVKNGADSNIIGPTNSMTSSIAGNGVQINGSNNNVIKGNTITANAANGVLLKNGSIANTVGGTGSSDGNQISGNLGTGASGKGGIHVDGGSSDMTTIQNNTIGVAGSGNSSHGILLTTGPDFTLIGGSAANAPNTIRDNGRDGVSVQGSGSDGNTISRNSIFNNVDLGIDLRDNGMDINDSGDGDSGPNQGQNWPDMTTVQIASNGDLVIEYSVDSTTGNATYPLTIEFFEAESAASNEGQTFLGSDSYPASSAQSSKVASLENAAALGVVMNDPIAATATDSAGNTSEFSAIVTVGTGTNPTDVEVASFTAQVTFKLTVVIRWETVSETNLVGFNIRRELTANRVRRQVNRQLIPARSSGRPTGGRYQVVDREVLTGETYNYYLELIRLDGSRDLVGPIQARVDPGITGPGDTTAQHQAVPTRD